MRRVTAVDVGRWSVVIACTIALAGAGQGDGRAARAAGDTGLPTVYQHHIGRDAPVGGSLGLIVALAVGPHDTLFAVDAGAGRVLRMDADDRLIGAWGSFGTGPGEFGQACMQGGVPPGSSSRWYDQRGKGPQCGYRMLAIGPGDVAIGPDGDVHVADPMNGRTQRFRPWGAFVQATCVLGPDPSRQSGCIVPDITPTWSIAIGLDGTIYVALAEHAIVRGLAADGSVRSEWGIEASDLVVDPAGRIWIGEPSDSRIRILEPNGNVAAKLDRLSSCYTPSPSPMGGIGPSEPCNPIAIALDPNGGAFLAELSEVSTPMIEHIDESGIRTPGVSPESMSIGIALAVGTDRMLHVPQSLYGGQGIVSFDAAGSRRSATTVLMGDPGDLPNPADIEWLPDGTFVVLDMATGHVQHRDASGRVLGIWGGLGSGDGLLAAPRGLTVEPNGNILVADTDNRRIQRFNAEGSHLATIGGPDNAAGGLIAPMDLVVADDGTIVVADAGHPWAKSRIVRYDRSGRFRGAWDILPNGAGPPRSMPMAMSPDGRIALLDAIGSRVLWLAADGRSMSGDTPTFDPDGVRRTPTAVDIEDDGEPLVALTGAGIVRYADNGRAESFAPAGCGDGVGSAPSGIAVAADGRLVVAQPDNDRVSVLDRTGAPIARSGYGVPAGTSDATFNRPSAVAVTRDSVVVADTGHDRLAWLDRSGAPVRSQADPGCGEHSLGSPAALTSAPGGGVIVGTADGRVRHVSAEGSLGRVWRQPDVLQLPSGIAVLHSDNPQSVPEVFVADAATGAIVHFHWDGTFVGAWFAGPAGVPLSAPHQIATAPDGTLWVADTGNHRIAHFTLDGTPLGTLGTGTRGADPGALDAPEGVAVLPDGTVIVADTGNRRLQAFAPDGTFLAAWRGDGPPGTALRRPAGLSIADDGTLWVADREADRIVVFGAAPEIGWHVRYYRDGGLLDGPVAAEWIPGRNLDLDWQGQPPAPGLGATGFSLRAERRAGSPLAGASSGGSAGGGAGGATSVLRRLSLAVRGGMTLIAPHGQPPVVLAGDSGTTAATTTVRRALDAEGDWLRVDFAATGARPMVRVVETLEGAVVLPFAGRDVP